MTSLRLKELIAQFFRKLEPLYFTRVQTVCFPDLILIVFGSLLSGDRYGACISVGTERITSALFTLHDNAVIADVDEFKQKNPDYVELCHKAKCEVDAIALVISTLPLPIAEEIAPEISPGYVKLS